ncbi:hypothetical protein OS493_036221 [Desmophyllum pertusum]|uniref:Uncharacterized protein n=1 Tax=Desmophyllum pertusum TaxID=174260 RepID=A0A9W9Y7M8_9CNID|nr:hypothetical protein OS493_036221 [Desmophyllum pertusum]
MGVTAGLKLIISCLKRVNPRVVLSDLTYLSHFTLVVFLVETRFRGILEFKSGGFHGSIYDVAIRFGVKNPFIQLSNFNKCARLVQRVAVVKGRNVGNERLMTSVLPVRHRVPMEEPASVKEQHTSCSCPAEWAGLYCHQSACAMLWLRQSLCQWYLPSRWVGYITIQTPLFKEFSYMLFQKSNIRSSTQITINSNPRHSVVFCFTSRMMTKAHQETSYP